jgi:hypothetical protein
VEHGPDGVNVEVFRTAELVSAGRLALTAVIVIALIALIPMSIARAWLPSSVATTAAVVAGVFVCGLTCVCVSSQTGMAWTS